MKKVFCFAAFALAFTGGAFAREHGGHHHREHERGHGHGGYRGPIIVPAVPIIVPRIPVFIPRLPFHR